MRKTIETIMHQNTPSAEHPYLAQLLQGASVVYGWGQKLHRMAVQSKAARKQLRCMVISVGNLTVGGTGKTPMVIYLTKQLRGAGFSVAILSRGYGGKAESKGGIVTDGQTLLMTSEIAGDEPVLLASQLPGVPIVVGRDRYRSGLLAVETFQPDIILLDDGFQHYGLHRDLDLVLLDGWRPLGNGHLLPRGTLREPLSGLKRADAVIMTRADHCEESQWAQLQHQFAEKPLFRANHQPVIAPSSLESEATPIQNLADLKGAPVLAFSGIGQNETFFQMIEAAGARLIGRLPFPDHFDYTPDDLRQIDRQATAYGVDYIVTTAKDAVRLQKDWAWSRPLIVLDAEIAFETKAFDQFLMTQVNHFLTPSA